MSEPTKEPTLKELREQWSPPPLPRLTKEAEVGAVPVARVWFVNALDTPSRQISNAECSPAIKQHGESLVCRFIPAWSCFEMVCGRNGAIASVDYLPATAIKSWKRAV